ncbi:MAG: hypothetical protein JHC85_15885 [Chthoniobacterales bacterium]|nr:hypothetical protein [Chthoniobacterales bacterium]
MSPSPTPAASKVWKSISFPSANSGKPSRRSHNYQKFDCSVLVEQPQVARSEHDAPDVDCRVLLESLLPVGEFAEVTVTGSQVYDLVAKANSES